jgi:hypothetical protein
MINVDPEGARKRLLPQSGWLPWQKPRPALEIDEWVAKQRFERGVLPVHIEQDGARLAVTNRGLRNCRTCRARRACALVLRDCRRAATQER